MITSTPTLDRFDAMALKYRKSNIISLALGICVLLAFPIIAIEYMLRETTTGYIKNL